MPTDPTQLDTFLAKINKSVSMELAILKSTPLSEEEYLIRFQNLQVQAAYQLLGECLIGEDIRQMETNKGLKEKGKSAGKTTKKMLLRLNIHALELEGAETFRNSL